MIQFTKDQTFILRAVTLRVLGDHQFNGQPLLKCSEPSQSGTKYADGTEVMAIEPAKGIGGWVCLFPNGEYAYVDSNKILANQAEIEAKRGKAVTKTGNGHASKASATPLDRVKALKAEKLAMEARLPQIEIELTAALKDLQKARAEQEAALAEAGLLDEVETDEQATA